MYVYLLVYVCIYLARDVPIFVGDYGVHTVSYRQIYVWTYICMYTYTYRTRHVPIFGKLRHIHSKLSPWLCMYAYVLVYKPILHGRRLSLWRSFGTYTGSHDWYRWMCVCICMCAFNYLIMYTLVDMFMCTQMYIRTCIHAVKFWQLYSELWKFNWICVCLHVHMHVLNAYTVCWCNTYTHDYLTLCYVTMYLLVCSINM